MHISPSFPWSYFVLFVKIKSAIASCYYLLSPTYTLLSLAFMPLLKNCTRNWISNLPSSLFSVLLLKISSFSWPLSVLPLKPDSTLPTSGKPSRLYYGHPKSPRKLYHISCINYYVLLYEFDHIILMCVCVCSDSSTKLQNPWGQKQCLLFLLGDRGAVTRYISYHNTQWTFINFESWIWMPNCLSFFLTYE